MGTKEYKPSRPIHSNDSHPESGALKANVQLIRCHNLGLLRHLPHLEEVCATIAISQTISKRIAGGRKVYVL
jgi:hypothetical protein